MTNTQRGNSGGNRVNVSEVSVKNGDVIVGGGDVYVTKGLDAAKIQASFDKLYQQINASAQIPAARKPKASGEVKALQSTITQAVQEGKPVKRDFLETRVRNLLRMGPDILDVVVSGLSGSAFGVIGVALKKIADRAKMESSQA